MPECFQSIVARLPQRELEVRRRCARDEHFRSICADFEEAAEALRRWQSAGASGERKAADYARFMDELETEILALMNEPESVPWRD